MRTRNSISYSFTHRLILSCIYKILKYLPIFHCTLSTTLNPHKYLTKPCILNSVDHTIHTNLLGRPTPLKIQYSNHPISFSHKSKATKGISVHCPRRHRESIPKKTTHTWILQQTSPVKVTIRKIFNVPGPPLLAAGEQVSFHLPLSRI